VHYPHATWSTTPTSNKDEKMEMKRRNGERAITAIWAICHIGSSVSTLQHFNHLTAAQP
jgi:hypothetical protein